jgi:hypothetical protein
MTTSTHVGRAFTLLSELNLVLGHLLHEVPDGDTDAAYAESEDAKAQGCTLKSQDRFWWCLLLYRNIIISRYINKNELQLKNWTDRVG